MQSDVNYVSRSLNTSSGTSTRLYMSNNASATVSVSIFFKGTASEYHVAQSTKVKKFFVTSWCNGSHNINQFSLKRLINQWCISPNIARGTDLLGTVFWQASHNRQKLVTPWCNPGRKKLIRILTAVFFTPKGPPNKES